MRTIINRLEKRFHKKGGEVSKQEGLEAGISFPKFTLLVEKKAYELFEKRGGEEGHALEDWCEAERIVEEEIIHGKINA